MPTEKKKKINREKCRTVTPTFRVSYPHVFKPQAYRDTDKPKYSITMLFPKSADLSPLKEIIKQAKIAAFGPDKSEWPDELESPVSDGNTHIDEATGEIKEGYKDHWVVKASSNEDQKPSVVDQDVEPIINQSDFYPGCYARAQVLATTWKYMRKQGVMLILDHVQKVKDGKPFGGKMPADKVFQPINSGESDDFQTEENESEGEESFL
jgi:hypothetical protein